MKYTIFEVLDHQFSQAETNLFISHLVKDSGLDKFIIKYKNTQILFKRDQDYGSLSGEYEEISSGGFIYLASSDGDFRENIHEKVTVAPFDLHSKESNFYQDYKGISIIIPIFGSTLYSRNIVANLILLSDEIRELHCKVLVSIDYQSDVLSARHLEIFQECGDLVASIFAQEKNLGFVENCNYLFDTSDSELVVLWTSDVKIPRGGLKRILKPLLEQSEIALATPYAYGGANLEAPENGFTSWRDFDACASRCKPEYPDAETNVGYLLAIDNRKLNLSKLFDSEIKNGYGDDSDLYYRVISKGFRGVLVDNLCVYHEHGASFSITEKRSYYQSYNFNGFMRKWGRVFRKRIEEKEEIIKNNNSRINILTGLYSALNYNKIEIVFILPTNDRRIGGVKAVFDICESLCENNIKSSVICVNTPVPPARKNEIEAIPFNNSVLVNRVLENAKLLVATSHDTVGLVKSVAKEKKTKIAYFVQGPEYSFSEGRYLKSVLDGYSGFDAIWAVSDFISERIKFWCDTTPIVVPYGPHEDKYYDFKGEREPRSIAVQFNGRLEKGADYIAALIAELVPLGYKFYSFGDESAKGKYHNHCKHLGFLDYKDKVNLFNRVQFYVDASHFEGLGLLLIESIRCGAFPVYRYNGGTADLLKRNGVGCTLGDYASIRGIGDILDAYALNERKRQAGVKDCKVAVLNHSVEHAVRKIIESLESIHE